MDEANSDNNSNYFLESSFSLELNVVSRCIIQYNAWRWYVRRVTPCSLNDVGSFSSGSDDGDTSSCDDVDGDVEVVVVVVVFAKDDCCVHVHV